MRQLARLRNSLGTRFDPAPQQVMLPRTDGETFSSFMVDLQRRFLQDQTGFRVFDDRVALPSLEEALAVSASWSIWKS